MRYRVPDTESWGRRGKLHAVDELDARARVLREQQVAVEVDVVAQARDLRRGGDSEPRLDHAPEHHAQAEGASGMRHPHRLPNPARFRELDVDPVRARGARGDVREGMAVLVEGGLNRRPLPERRS